MYPLMFLVFAGAAVAFALNLLLQRQPIYSALSLLGVMGSLAALYLMLGAELVAAVQILVSAGAALVLFVFVVMVSNAGEEQRAQRSRLVRHLGGPLIILILGVIASVLYWQFPEDAVVRFGDFPGQAAGIGIQLFLHYLLPFEAIPVLILVAIIGAVVLAQRTES